MEEASKVNEQLAVIMSGLESAPKCTEEESRAYDWTHSIEPRLAAAGFPVRFRRQIAFSIPGQLSAIQAAAPQVQAYRECCETLRGTGAIVALIGARGCISGATRVYDPVERTAVPVEELHRQGRSFHVLSLTQRGVRTCQASAPFVKGYADLWRVSFEDGREITVADEHRFLTPRGWLPLDRLSVGHALGCWSGQHPSILGNAPSKSPECAVSFCETAQGYQDRCSAYFRPDGGRLPMEANSDRVLFPSQGDALAHSHQLFFAGDSETLRAHIRLHQSTDPRSRNSYPPWVEPFLDMPHPSLKLRRDEESAFESIAGEPPLSYSQDEQQFPQACDLKDTVIESLPSARKAYNACAESIRFVRIRSITNVGFQAYYDLTVPGSENYYAEGVWNHNTGKTTIGAQIAIARAWRWWDRLPTPGIPRYLKLTDLIAYLKPIYSDFGTTQGAEIALYRDRVCETSLLIIDEIHECEDRKLKDRILTDVIDRRYANRVDSLLIGNQTVKSFEETTNASVLSRMKEHGRIISCSWPGFR